MSEADGADAGSRRLAAVVTSSPRTVIALVAVVTLFFALQLTRLRIDESADGLLLANDPERAVVAELGASFGLDEILVVAIRADDVFAADVLEAVRRLGAAFAQVDGVSDVLSLATAQRISGNAEGISIGPLVPPGSLSERERRDLREHALGSPLYARHLVSTDGRTTALVLFLRDLSQEVDARPRIVRSVREIAAREGAGLDLYIAGTPHGKVVLAQQLFRDMSVLTPLTMAVLTGVMLLCFGTLRGVLLPALTVGVALVWTMGGLALSGVPITMLTNVLPGMVQILGTSYSVFLMSSYYEAVSAGAEGRQAASDMLVHVTRPVVVSALTTAAGFLSLATSDVATVKALAVFGAAGVVASMVLGLTLLPAVLSLLQAKPMHPSRLVAAALDRVLWGLTRVAERHPRWIVGGAGVVVLMSAIGVLRLSVETDYIAYLPRDSEVPVNNRRLAQELSGPVLLYVAIDGDEPGAVTRPGLLRKIAAVQRFAESVEGVDATLSAADYVEAVHGALSGGHPDPPLPETKAQTAECLGLYAAFAPTNELSHYVSEDRRRANVLVRTHLTNSRDLGRGIARIRQGANEIFAGEPAKVTVTGTIVLINKTADAISRGQMRSLVLSLAGVGLILWFALKSPRYALAALPSNLLPVLIPYGLMGFLGIPLSTATSLVASLVFGISVDDTVHYLMRYRSERAAGKEPAKAFAETTRAVGPPMLFTAVSLALGFSVLMISSFTPVRAFGGLTALTWIAAVVTDLFLLPVILVGGDAWLQRDTRSRSGASG